MIEHRLLIPLPPPWANQTFQTDHIGEINFLVGPNGSGKSQFARQLFNHLEGSQGHARLLGTDRLSGMEQVRAFRHLIGDHFAQGFDKGQFDYFKQAGAEGSGIDTFVLLEERMDLRIQVEATLSHLFDREILLEWDSGRLMAKIRRLGSSDAYRLDRDECHGIKEILVLLTHLYDDKNQYLIIDEPELNLHPQYQAFFMQEVRKVAGDPTINTRRKGVFLITHSPFILDLQSEDDLKSVISFDLDYSIPKQIYNLDLDGKGIRSLVHRLNSHHKQLFFSDNPIFVEGLLDAQLINAMMETRGASAAGAGSCVIDAGGAEEVDHYLKLCQGLGKEAHFLYDLDSLFRGSLRKCMGDDQSIRSFLASAGLGNDLVKYCGQLEGKLTDLVKTQLFNVPLPPRLARLGEFLGSFGSWPWSSANLTKARTAVMTAISRYRDDVIMAVSEQAVTDIEGHLGQILSALRQKNVHVLPGGTIERYLPCYASDDYELPDEAKRQAVIDELQELSKPMTETELSSRYGDLYDVVCELPSKGGVDVEPVFRKYLSGYIHELQQTVINNPHWQSEQIQVRLNTTLPSISRVFSIQSFERHERNEFRAVIQISEMLDEHRRITNVDHNTNAGMGDFTIEVDPTPSDATQ